MRFLKDIIARKAEMPHPELPADIDPDAAEVADWHEAYAEMAFSDETFEAMAHPPSGEPALETAEETPETAEAEQFELSEIQDLLDDPDEPVRDDEPARIWEMCDEEDDEVEPEEPMIMEPANSQGELAREALKSMIESPPVSENIARPSRATSRVSLTLAVSQQLPRAGRAKTRMLGFHSPEQAVSQVFDRLDSKGNNTDDRYPVGWLVVIEGPGRGTSFPLHCGVTTVGRGREQKVTLDFGDTSISRDSHAVIAYDDDTNGFFVGHTGKANLVRLNGRPVLSTEEISNFDLIRIGETTLRFVGFCGPEFAWDMTGDEEIVHARAS